MVGVSLYADRIRALAPTLDARHVEVFMRLEHPVLDGLAPSQFAASVAVSVECILIAGPIESESLAVSFGL